MRHYNPVHSYPLLGASISLVTSIMACYFLHLTLPVAFPICLSLISWAIAFVCKTRIAQTLSIYLTIFFIGFTLTNNQIKIRNTIPSFYSYHELSHLDRIKLKALSWRQDIEHTYQKQHITQQDLAIISAMTLGDKSHINKDTRTVFSISGASHILAVSGLHIGIIFQIFIFIFGKRKKNNPISIMCALLCIWSYTIFIGMPASALRASCMISIYSIGLLLRRKNFSVNGLLLAAIAMLIYSPLLLFDISFQLSFIAVGAILILSPLFNKHPIGISLAAQIGTLPIMAYYFGRISCYSILSNIIAIPSASIILYLTLLFLICHPFSTLQAWIGIALSNVAKFTNFSLSWISNLPGASIEGVQINILQLCLSYGVIVAGYLLIRKFHQFHLHRSHLSSSGRVDNFPANQT